MKNLTIVFAVIICVTVRVNGQDIEQMMDAKPFTWYGNISAYAEAYDPEGIEPRGGTLNWGLNGNAGFSVYGWDVPFAFSVGRQRSSFNYPIYNQFGLSPKYKWVTVHLGHRNLYFSPFTLGGHTMQGVGFELNPGQLRIGAMAGTLRKPVQIRLEDINEVIPAYRRQGYAVKLGLGTNENYVDLTFFKAKDDSTSLENPFNPDLTPGANTALGLSVRRQLGKGLHLELESGLSVYTRDQASDLFAEDQEESFWGKIFDLRYSTRINIATKAMLEYQKGKWRTRLGYDRIDPEYETMGTYYFENDVEKFVLGISGPVNTIISVQANAGLQHNNLLETRNARTSRFVGSANADIHPKPHYGVNISYSNFNMQQKESLVPLNDSARLSNASQTIVISPRYSILKGEKTHSFSLTLMDQFLNNKNPLNAAGGDFKSKFITFMYAVNLDAMHQVNAGVNWNRISIGDFRSGQYGGSAGYQFHWVEKMITAGINGTYNVPSGQTETKGKNIYLTANAGWQIKKLQLGVYYQFLKYSQQPVLDYSESRMGTTVSYSFQ